MCVCVVPMFVPFSSITHFSSFSAAVEIIRYVLFFIFFFFHSFVRLVYLFDTLLRTTFFLYFLALVYDCPWVEKSSKYQIVCDIEREREWWREWKIECLCIKAMLSFFLLLLRSFIWRADKRERREGKKKTQIEQEYIEPLFDSDVRVCMCGANIFVLKSCV